MTESQNPQTAKLIKIRVLLTTSDFHPDTFICFVNILQTHFYNHTTSGHATRLTHSSVRCSVSTHRLQTLRAALGDPQGGTDCLFTADEGPWRSGQQHQPPHGHCSPNRSEHIYFLSHRQKCAHIYNAGLNLYNTQHYHTRLYNWIEWKQSVVLRGQKMLK